MVEDNSHAQRTVRRQWPLWRVVGSSLIVLIVFGLGVGVGRGDINIHGLTPNNTNAHLTNQLDYSSVDKVYSLLKQNYDGTLEQAKLIEGLKKGLVSSTGDPYTEYFNPTEARAFNDALSGSITGIGAELGSNTENQIVIVAPLSGYPAEKAGIKPGDVITAVNNETTSGMSVYAAVQKIRGPVGTQVKLTIVRGSAAAFELTITREKITIPSVEYKVEGAVGYLKIGQFTVDTSALAKKAAEAFKAQSVKAIVVDLRNNPGGYLSSSVEISSLWLDKGKTVVSERRGNKIIETQTARGNNILKGLPTVVLINGGSASASEIMAGALRDNGAATLIGEKSFGKGSVQQVESLPDGSELKVTIARWHTPKGANIDKQGITPDIVMTNSEADVKAGKDPQKDRAYQEVQTKL